MSNNKNIKSESKRVSQSVTLSGNVIGKKVNLSNASSQNIEKVTNLMVDLIRRQKRLWRKEITDWQAARYAYYQSDIPKNFPMQELYEQRSVQGRS